MNSAIHNRIEAIAGAIALGEADDAQRREYREHLSSCARCLKEAGRRARARTRRCDGRRRAEDEKWQPDLRNAVASRMQRRAYNLRYGFGIAGLCLAVSLGVHALVVAGITPFTTGTQKTVAADTGATRIVLEQRVPVNQQGVRAAQAAPQRQLVVMHNIVSMQRAAVTSAQNPANARACSRARSPRSRFIPSRSTARKRARPPAQPYPASTMPRGRRSPRPRPRR